MSSSKDYGGILLVAGLARRLRQSESSFAFMVSGRWRVQDSKRVRRKNEWLACGIAAALLLALAFCVASLAGGWLRSQGTAAPVVALVSKELELDGFRPTTEVLHDVEVVWQAAEEARGTLLLFHGCQHGGADWYVLPEEKDVTRRALDAGISVVAFTSQDRMSGCWGHRWPGAMPCTDERRHKDLVAVAAAVEELLQRSWAHSRPVHLLGASAGAMFASMLPHQLPGIAFRSASLYIAPGLQEAYTSTSVLPLGYPRTAFVHMPADSRTAAAVSGARGVLEGQEVQTAEWVCHRTKLTAFTFEERLRYRGRGSEGSRVTTGQSLRLLKLLQSYQLVDQEGALRQDPRQVDWDGLLERDEESRPVVFAWREEMREVLNAHWAVHEMTGCHATDVIAWMVGEQ